MYTIQVSTMFLLKEKKTYTDLKYQHAHMRNTFQLVNTPNIQKKLSQLLPQLNTHIRVDLKYQNAQTRNAFQ